MNNMEKKGLVHIYTGNGKGKTTCSVGLAVRAIGHGFKVVYSCFLKRVGLYGYNEIDILRRLGTKVFVFTEGHPHFNPNVDLAQLKLDIQKALNVLSEYIKKEGTELLILDEILVAVRDNFLEEEELISFIKSKPAHCELVLTGRGATKELINMADYVSEIGIVKHPFEQGIASREGIEF